MPIRGILFDKDGTLFDFHASWSRWASNLIDELSGGDPVLADDLAARLGYDRQQQRFDADSLSIAGTVAEQAAAIAPALPAMTEHDILSHLIDAAQAAQMVPVAALSQTLDAFLARGVVLGVATNDAEASARAHLERDGLTDRFAFVAGFDSGHGAKPDPGMCRAFATHAGLDPAEILMVGDSTHDLVAGRAAGMQVAGVLTGLADRADLSPYADLVVPDVSHLVEWLATRQPNSADRRQKAT